MDIFVANIPYRASDDELRKHFEPYGTVTSARIINDRETGRSRGFGFVEMPNHSEAEKAVAELDGQAFNGRPLKVNESRPRR